MGPTISIMTRAGKKAWGRVKKQGLKGFQAVLDSSLKLHRDTPTGLRGQLIAMDQGKTADGRASAGLVIVPGTAQPVPAGGFSPIKAEEQAGFEPRARVVEAPAGSFIFWDESAVHSNAGPDHALPTVGEATVPLAEALLDPDRVRAFVHEHGYCVVTGLLAPHECAAMIEAAKTAIRASCAREGAGFKGAGGNGLWKHYGVSTHEDLRPFSVHPNVVALWRGVLGAEQICFSPDALAFMAERNETGGHDVDRPTRVTQILCYGRASDQLVGTGAKKLAYYRQGGSCNHPPCVLSKGGSGRHYSDRLNEWRAQVPTFGKDPAVDARFIELLGP